MIFNRLIVEVEKAEVNQKMGVLRDYFPKLLKEKIQILNSGFDIIG